MVKLGIAAVRRSPSLHVATENVDDAMLNLLGDTNKIHIIATAGGALNLEVVTVVLVESLQTFNEEEVCREPWPST